MCINSDNVMDDIEIDRRIKKVYSIEEENDDDFSKI